MTKQLECSVFGLDNDAASHKEDSEEDKAEDTPAAMRICCLKFLVSYTVSGTIDLTTIVGTDVLALVVTIGTSFEPSEFDPSLHPG